MNHHRIQWNRYQGRLSRMINVWSKYDLVVVVITEEKQTKNMVTIVFVMTATNINEGYRESGKKSFVMLMYQFWIRL